MQTVEIKIRLQRTWSPIADLATTDRFEGRNLEGETQAAQRARVRRHRMYFLITDPQCSITPFQSRMNTIYI